MAKDTVRSWDVVASNNTDIAGIGIQGTNAVSNFDGGLRAVMAQIAAVDEGTTPVNDTWSFCDPADPTKIFRFDGGSIATATTRTITMPNASGTMPLPNVSQGWTATQQFDDLRISTGSRLHFTTGGNNDYLEYDDSTNVYSFFADTSASSSITSVGESRASGLFLSGWTTPPTLTSNTAEGAQIGPNSQISRSGSTPLYLQRTTNDGRILEFFRQLSRVGDVSVTTTATTYNTSSDYRLKGDIKDLTGSAAFIDALQPRKWVWKSTGEAGAGFIAHEVQAVSPTSVTGQKDAIDEDGNPAYQAMQPGSPEIIANLVAELKSLRRRMGALETAYFTLASQT